MAAASNWLEDEIIKHIFRTGSFTKPTVLAVALCTAAPVDGDTGATITEVANANGYARKLNNPLDANWTATAGGDGQTDNTGVLTFDTATGSWGTVTHFAICNSATWGAGDMLIHGILDASKLVGNNDIFRFNANTLKIAVA